MLLGGCLCHVLGCPLSHFDEEGAYHFKKDGDHAGDVWLEGVGVYKGPVRPAFVPGSGDGSDDTGDIDRYAVMEEMLTLMQQHESVNAAIRRLDAASKPPRPSGRKAKRSSSKGAASSSSSSTSAKEPSEKEAKAAALLLFEGKGPDTAD